MNEKSWASLAPLLDHRRYVESVVAGITIPAHPDFRCCVTMNEDESTYEVPDYILSRLQPTLALGFRPRRRDGRSSSTTCRSPSRNAGPDRQFPPDAASAQFGFFSEGRPCISSVCPQTSVSGLRPHPLAKDTVWREAVSKVLGEEALDLEGLSKRRARALGGRALAKLGDFF